MKKILIVSHAMEIGGVERSLLDMLYSIDTSRVQVDLFLYRHSGEWLHMIPQKVHLLPEIPQYACLAVPAAEVLKKGQWQILYGRAKGKWKAKKYSKKYKLKNSTVGIEYSHKYTRKYMPNIQPDTEYDLAISFLTPHYFVTEKVRAKKKIAWIHTDYSYIDVDIASERDMWNKYDKIASISDSCTKGFLSKFPELESKILCIENVLSDELIWKQAGTQIPDEMNGQKNTYKLLSVGRFSHAKNFDNIPDICRRILESGIQIIWYLIGYGGDESLIRQKIEESGMQEHVVILGKKSNPYPYIKACDLYVQPSRYEGKCVAVREAQILQKPVVITRYATSASQLRDGVDGVIVPMDNLGCAEGIVRLLRNPEKMKKLSQNCAEREYTNAAEIEKIYAILEEDTLE